MPPRLVFSSLLLVALFLALSPAAQASTIWYVDGVHGSDQNNCRTPLTACKTIGHAISLASSGDSIMVAAATYPENLTIGISLTVIGSGSATTIIDGGGLNTVVTISSANAHVTLSNLTIRNGGYANNPYYGGGVLNPGTLTISNSSLTGNIGHALSGGGITNSGTLTVSNSTLTGNFTLGQGGGILNSGSAMINNTVLSTDGANVSGGGISNGGTLTISNSTLSGNRAVYAGGIENHRTLTINNSTLSGNVATGSRFRHGQGGGIYAMVGTVTISNTTLSGNSALQGGGILNGGAATTTLQNSIVANSYMGGSCSGVLTSNGYNLSSDNTCNFHSTGDLNNTNPLLGPLQNNGGPTQTMALQSGSPAIDAGNPSGCKDGSGHLLTTDQRGMPRPDHEDTGGCDMGAYERQSD